ncbi:hypothetical protein VTK73DRAFT_6111 [Phialemonium thermophilum]|uniref:Uncharacterized protein n=1 Tax=Phialemonium thermophilum TaxID=223376 RepID=A0ABR3WKY5_9PEZI
MIAKYILPAVAAFGSAAAQCSKATATINAPADATGLSSCRTYQGSILINTGAQGNIDLSGIERITGDLICENNGVVSSIAGSTLGTIEGDFKLTNLSVLNNLGFPSLKTVGSILWTSLPSFDTLNFGTPGVTKAKVVTISDTFLTALDGIDLKTVDTLNINNNRRLTDMTIQLENLSNVLNIQANGDDLRVNLPNLVWIANMTIANVSSISFPSLEVVNGSARFDSNYISTFTAPNLTSTTSGDLSFVGNSNLTNITVPALTKVGGGLLIANNTGLEHLDGFPKLKTVLGAVKLRGSFKDIAFPALNDVRGAFDVSSTEDITDSCDKFKALAPSKQGGNGKIQGTYTCTSNNENANNDTSGNTSGGKGSSGSGSGDGKKNAGVGLAFNAAILGLAVVGGLVALL